MDVMVSAHGWRPYAGCAPGGGATFQLPANVTVKFYVYDGGILYQGGVNDVGAWQLYNHLNNNGLPINQAYMNAHAVQTIAGGSPCLDYQYGSMADLDQNGTAYADASKVICVSANQNNANFPALNPIPNDNGVRKLSGVVQAAAQSQDGATIYWLCCREVV